MCAIHTCPSSCVLDVPHTHYPSSVCAGCIGRVTHAQYCPPPLCCRGCLSHPRYSLSVRRMPRVYRNTTLTHTRPIFLSFYMLRVLHTLPLFSSSCICFMHRFWIKLLQCQSVIGRLSLLRWMPDWAHLMVLNSCRMQGHCVHA